MSLRTLACFLIACLVSGCALLPEGREAAATRVAGEVYATQTAEAPTPTATFTDTPVPTATPIPPTPTPYIVAGADGVNVRAGPATTYERLGYLDPGTQAPLTGREGDWWQIAYKDAPAWVYGPLVTPYNIETTTPTP